MSVTNSYGGIVCCGQCHRSFIPVWMNPGSSRHYMEYQGGWSSRATLAAGCCCRCVLHLGKQRAATLVLHTFATVACVQHWAVAGVVVLAVYNNVCCQRCEGVIHGLLPIVSWLTCFAVLVPQKCWLGCARHACRGMLKLLRS